MTKSITVSETYVSITQRVIIFTLVMFLLLILAISYLTFSDMSEYRPFWGTPELPPIVCNMTVVKDEKLDMVLKAASKNFNKTVIITIVNKAYVEGDESMLEFFLNGLWFGIGTRGLIDNLVIAAMDQTSYEWCKSRKFHCYKLETKGVDFDGEKVYMSDDFIKMMWRRTLFIGDVVKRGYTVVFTDTDVLWVRNPFLLLNRNRTIDFQMSTDVFDGNPWSKSNSINTGFYMVRPSNRTAAVFDTWYSLKSSARGLKEQDVLNILMRYGLFQKLGVSIRFLNTRFFSGFCQDSRNPSVVMTIHANCCRRIAPKMVDLRRVVRDLKRYRRLKNKWRFKWSNHTACKRSWDDDDYY